MSYETEDIAQTLKAARKRKGLSQRALSAASGVPQGHISRIENSAVDIRVSSLVALARALDLELTLVPRKAVTAVRSVARSSEKSSPSGAAALGKASKELEELRKRTQNALGIAPSSEELTRLHQRARELENFFLGANELKTVRSANQALKEFQETLANSEPREGLQSIQDSFQGGEALRKALAEIEKTRNQLAHSVAALPVEEFPRPAYRLEEDDDG